MYNVFLLRQNFFVSGSFWCFYKATFELCCNMHHFLIVYKNLWCEHLLRIDSTTWGNRFIFKRLLVCLSKKTLLFLPLGHVTFAINREVIYSNAVIFFLPSSSLIHFAAFLITLIQPFTNITAHASIQRCLSQIIRLTLSRAI